MIGVRCCVNSVSVTDPKDLTQITDQTRRLGQAVVRGTQISLICPSDELQEIANPFQAEGEGEETA